MPHGVINQLLSQTEAYKITCGSSPRQFLCFTGLRKNIQSLSMEV